MTKTNKFGKDNIAYSNHIILISRDTICFLIAASSIDNFYQMLVPVCCFSTSLPLVTRMLLSNLLLHTINLVRLNKYALHFQETISHENDT